MSESKDNKQPAPDTQPTVNTNLFVPPSNLFGDNTVLSPPAGAQSGNPPQSNTSAGSQPSAPQPGGLFGGQTPSLFGHEFAGATGNQGVTIPTTQSTLFGQNLPNLNPSLGSSFSSLTSPISLFGAPSSNHPFGASTTLFGGQPGTLFGTSSNGLFSQQIGSHPLFGWRPVQPVVAPELPEAANLPQPQPGPDPFGLISRADQRSARNVGYVEGRGTFDWVRTIVTDKTGCPFTCFLVSDSYISLDKSIEELRAEDYKLLKSGRRPTTSTKSSKQSLVCRSHSGNHSDQYCITCSELMCWKCRMQHIKGHRVEPITNIIMETMGKLEERKAKLDAVSASFDTVNSLTYDKKLANATKASIKNRFNDLIDKIFAASFEKSLEKPLKKLDYLRDCIVKEERKNCELNEKVNSLDKWLYEDNNYEEICKFYKEVTADSSDLEDYKNLHGLEEIKNQKLPEKAQEIQECIERSINFDAVCSNCDGSLIDEIMKGNVTRRACLECEAKYKELKWANGTTMHQGTKDSWSTFCSKTKLPKYFECKVKILEDSELKEGERFIGLSIDECDSNTGCYDTIKNWWALSKKGLYESGSKLDESKEDIFKEGDVVTVIYNNANILKFEVNGKPVEGTISGIEGPFYLACADHTGSQYEIQSLTIL